MHQDCIHRNVLQNTSLVPLGAFILWSLSPLCYSLLKGLSNHSNLWELTLYEVINSLFIQSLCITLEHGRSIIGDIICQCMMLGIYHSPHHCMPFLDTKHSNPTPTPETIGQLQEECFRSFGWQPCRWQSAIAFELLQKRTLVSISATGSGKSRVFWLPMRYEKGMSIITVPLKSLGQQLADESSWEGFRGVSVTAELLGESPNLLAIRYYSELKVLL